MNNVKLKIRDGSEKRQEEKYKEILSDSPFLMTKSGSIV